MKAAKANLKTIWETVTTGANIDFSIGAEMLDRQPKTWRAYEMKYFMVGSKVNNQVLLDCGLPKHSDVIQENRTSTLVNACVSCPKVFNVITCQMTWSNCCISSSVHSFSWLALAWTMRQLHTSLRRGGARW
jgi:hypothetical protein